MTEDFNRIVKLEKRVADLEAKANAADEIMAACNKMIGWVLDITAKDGLARIDHALNKIEAEQARSSAAKQDRGTA